jgi:hypothetical protein
VEIRREGRSSSGLFFGREPHRFLDDLLQLSMMTQRGMQAR